MQECETLTPLASGLWHLASLRKDISDRKYIEFKLKNWPVRDLGKMLDLTHGPGAEFVETKRMRNAIVHFASTHESVELSPYSLYGVADTTEYDGLNHTDAKRALTSVEGLVAEFFRLAGLSPSEVAGAIHSWAGKIAA